MKTLAELRAELKQKLEALQGLKTKAKATDAKAEDKEAYKAALKEITELSDEIEELEAEERAEALKSKAAGNKAGEADEEESEGNTLWAQVKNHETEGPSFTLSMIAATHAKQQTLQRSGIVKDAITLMREDGFDRFADDMLRDQAKRARREGRILKTNSSLTPQDGGILLPTPNSGTIIPFLRAENTFINNGPRRIPLIGGRFNQPRGATPSTAGYVGEGARKPVGSPTFDGISMSSKKIAGIVMMTEEVLRWSIADIRGYVVDDLRQTLATNMDTALYFGPGSATVPLGILQRDAAINVFDASTTGTGAFFADPKKPTVAEIDRMGTIMLLAITDRNISPRSAKWSMNYHLLEYMMNARGQNQQYIYPELRTATPTWKNFPIAVTNAFPNNGGAATDESILALITWDNVLYGEDQDITVRTSNEATIDPGTGVLVHLFQQNMMAVLMEARHDVALQRAGAISVLRKARWGSLAG